MLSYRKLPHQKNGEEFRQKSIGAVRCSQATSYDDWRRRAASMKLTGTDGQTGGQAGRQTFLLGGCTSKNVSNTRLNLNALNSFFAQHSFSKQDKLEVN